MLMKKLMFAAVATAALSALAGYAASKDLNLLDDEGRKDLCDYNSQRRVSRMLNNDVL